MSGSITVLWTNRRPRRLQWLSRIIPPVSTSLPVRHAWPAVCMPSYTSSASTTNSVPKDHNKKALEANLAFAKNLDAEVIRLKGKSVADTVADFVRSKHITQVVFGRAPVRDWRKYFYLSAIHRFLRESPAVDVHIVTQESEES